MKNMKKKIAIFSMVGLLQIGLGASVIEASPLHHNSLPAYQQYDDRDHDGDRPDRHDEDRDKQIREEKERHDREMKRRPHENDRDWRDRQEREKEHHEEIMRTLGALAIVTILANN